MNPLKLMDEMTRAELQAENARLRAALTQAREALEAVEYYYGDECPWCGEPPYDNETGDVIGHSVNCGRQRALEAIKGLE